MNSYTGFSLNQFIVLAHICGTDRIWLACRHPDMQHSSRSSHPRFFRYDHLSFLGVDFKRFFDIRKLHGGFLPVEPVCGLFRESNFFIMPPFKFIICNRNASLVPKGYPANPFLQMDDLSDRVNRGYKLLPQLK